MALFGMKGVEALLAAQQQPMPQQMERPVDPARLAAISQPRKKGLFGGNAFRADSPLWHIMGGVGDVLTGEQVYTQGLMQQREKQRKSLMEQAQAEAEDAQWYEREKWKRANPEPVNNDTVNDYQYIEKVLGKEAADQYLRRLGDPMVNMTLPGDNFYSGPQSGLGPALGGQQPKPRRLGPVVDQIPGGPASPAPGGFPR
jgi:hypothetical protein